MSRQPVRTLGKGKTVERPQDGQRRTSTEACVVVALDAARPFEPASRHWLVGVDSAREGYPDLSRALDGVPADGFKVLLAHEPDFADRVRPAPVHLQLSGHSHGGQIVVPSVPIRWLPRLGKKYPRGLYRIGDMVLYTNRGLGAGVLPLRHNCPPEITVIQLQRAK